MTHKQLSNANFDIPPKFAKLQAYRATIGHKGLFEFFFVVSQNSYVRMLVAANHSFRNNAEYQPFPFHPVLGFTMAIVAVKDISEGSEVKIGVFKNTL